MPKGQSSIDLMIAIMVALVFFAVLSSHNENLSTQTSEISVKNGLRAVLLDVYSAVGSAKAYGLTIEYVSPKIRTGQSSGPLDCTIIFRNNGSGDYDINIVYNNTGEIYSGIDLTGVKIDNIALPVGTPTRKVCGEKFTIGV